MCVCVCVCVCILQCSQSGVGLINSNFEYLNIPGKELNVTDITEQ